MTSFFEVINVSAAHIYHSALELSPVSSIVRRLYHYRHITRSPEVVIGTSDLWDQGVAVSSKNNYSGPCTWSPCGQFVAARTEGVVEIRNQLTLEQITILHPPGMIADFKEGPLGYSPDGRFIAYAPRTAGIMVWDIQTGGVAKEIKHSVENDSLVWSSDGGTICAIGSDEGTIRVTRSDEGTICAIGWGHPSAVFVHTYDISSGTISSPGTLKSNGKPYLWVDDESFWIMTMRNGGNGIDIFEVGPTLARIRSFDFSPILIARIGSFSPTTHRVCISSSDQFRIFDIQNSNLLLDATHDYNSQCFSSDGSLFAASRDSVRIWEYTSGRYVPWREFQYQDSATSLQFSPTQSSILHRSRGILRVWRLHELPATPKTHRQQLVGLSRSGTHVATAYELENTVTIIDLVGRSPPQFIDTDVEIQGLILRGNVLVVGGARETVAWLLTEEGLVDGVVGDRRVVRSDSIWTTSQHKGPSRFLDWDQIGILVLHTNAWYIYDTETGEVLDPTQIAEDDYGFRSYYNNTPQRNTPPEDRWQTSRGTLLEGWVKDAEGKHRMWVPVEWRDGWNLAGWHHDATTQFSYIEGRFVLVKF